MAARDIRRRWKRRVIIFLVLVNAALWASYAWLGGSTPRLRNRPRTPVAPIQPARATIAR